MCAERLAREGADVTLVARSAGHLAEAAARIKAAIASKVSAGTESDSDAEIEFNGDAVATPRINFLAADVSTAEGRALTLSACSEVDVLITHAGVPQRFAHF